MENWIDTILKEIGIRCDENRKIIVAIDGRCAAGKTTLAAHLQRKVDCNVVHMDEFFLRPEQRTKERLEKPGGNVDYERFHEEVLKPLRRGEPFSYCPYDCQRQSLLSPIHVSPKKVNIVEGAYSCHPQFGNQYDLEVFLSIDPEKQRQRILKRNGTVAALAFEEKWIPLEEKYFKAYRIEEHCDLRFQ